MNNIAIVGAGGLGKEIAVLIHQINAIKPVWKVVGFYDDNVKTPVAGWPVVGSIASLNTQAKLAIVVAVGSPIVKQKIVESLTNPNLYFPSLAHPDATIGLNVTMGEGSIVTAGCRLTVDINLGKHVLVNLNSTIGHDVTIGDYCSIMPGVHLSGFVTVGKGVMIGTGASVLQRIKVADGSQVGASALVRTDVTAGTTVMGVPARETKR